jgi:hypothetical protein
VFGFIFRAFRLLWKRTLAANRSKDKKAAESSGGNDDAKVAKE